MLNLTRFRLAKRWSRAELARRARIAAGDLGKIESGRLQPYDSQLRKLARALGIPSDAAPTLLTNTVPPDEAA
jgi:transcriptional regulator with XRE-family HTH domain